MDCPKCRLTNPATALRCDCGYDFSTGEVKEIYLDQGKDTRYRGVAGWLLFFCISLTIFNPLVFIADIFGSTSGIMKLNFEGLNAILPFVIIVDVVFTVFCVYAGVRLWTVSKDAVKLAKACLVCLLVIGTVSSIVVIALLQPITTANNISTGSIINEFLPGIVRGCVYTGIWYAYLSKSQRVKATYGNS